MVPILNAPVRADGAGEGLGVETDLAGVAADLLARRPDRVSFSKVRRETRATQAISGCHSGSSWCRRLRPADAPGDAAGLVAVEGAVLGAQPGQCFMQGGLVLLHLDQQAISAVRVKLSFWQCRASAVNNTPPAR